MTVSGAFHEGLVWPAAELGPAVDALARAMRLVDPAAETAPTGVVANHQDAAVADAAERLGIAARRWRIPDGEVERWLGQRRAALVPVPHQGILVIAGTRASGVDVMGPDRRLHRARIEDVLKALGAASPDAAGDDMQGLLEASGMAGRAAQRVARAIRGARQSDRHFVTAWTLLPSPGRPQPAKVRNRWLALGAIVLSMAVAQTACVMLAWWVLGRHALAGHVDEGWLTAFLLLLLTALPLHALGRIAQGQLAFGLGAALQARLFLGALRLRPEEVRGEGAGRMLARVFESVRLQSTGMGAAFAALAGAVQLPFALWVLAQGGAPRAGPLLLVAAVLAVALVTVALLRRQRVWTRLRAEHTETLVELMLGHRTRLAQEPPAMRHQKEDAELSRLVEASSAVDGAALPLLAVIPRAFFIAGLLAQAASMLGQADATRLAIGLGGVLLGHAALTVVCLGARQLCTAVLSWEQVKDLAAAAARGLRPASSAVGPLAAAGQGRGPVIEARGVAFTYPDRRRPAIADVEIAVARGDRMLVEGATGAGKSTMLSVLGGLRVPTEGAVLLKGLDARVWGDAWWKRQVVLAPQFHENHVFAAPLAFNVLLGRGWPPGSGDLDEAETVCRELGLGPLIDRMPAGLMQPVGETGWQLSHGERTRVFLARALLQKAELVLLDETFAALDPDTLQVALECGRRRAGTLMVVAHP